MPLLKEPFPDLDFPARMKIRRGLNTTHDVTTC